jgi:flagellar hook-associated protein 2
MSDYSMLGSFSTGSASNLNGELIQKLKDAESASKIDPITESLELIDKEEEKIAEINDKVNELLTAIKPFDLFNSTSTVFDQISATTTGEAAIFDAVDIGALKEGRINVNISQIAQRDAYQTKTFASEDSVITTDASQSITINGQTFSTTNVTLSELATTITNNGIANASVEQVSDTEYRLVVKSTEPGVSNQLTITETDVNDLGLTDPTDTNGDGITDNHILVGQNLKATVDGVSYDVSSDSITIDGNLKITGTKTGDSSISIKKDDSAIIPAIQEFANQYNELLVMITEEINSDESSVQDKSTLRTILSDIKNMMYEEYGPNDANVFNYGFSFDKLGVLTIDEKVLGEALTNDIDDVKNLFLGVAEDKGFGTLLKEHLDDLNSYNGLFSTYESSMDSRKTTLEEEKEKAVNSLDTKYDAMAAQFSAYAAIITQMESSFSGLKMMIEQESSSN